MRSTRHLQRSGGVLGAVLHVVIVLCVVIGLDVWLIYSVWFK